jgi:hypothetical protein
MNAKLESVYGRLLEQHEKHIANMNLNTDTETSETGRFEVKEHFPASRNQPREIFDDIFFDKEIISVIPSVTRI